MPMESRQTLRRGRRLELPPSDVSLSLLFAYLLTLVTLALVYAILAMSLDLLLDYMGLSSLDYAA